MVDVHQYEDGLIGVSDNVTTIFLTPENIAEINRIVAERQKKIENEERALLARLLAKYPPPAVPPIMWPPPCGPGEPFPLKPWSDTTGTCAKCGITLSRVMGYVCPRNDCPSGLGGHVTMGGFGT